MKTSLILGHPNPSSFTHAIAQAITTVLTQEGHDLRFHDLYREGFDPVLTLPEMAGQPSGDPLVELHCQQAVEADAFVIVHPNWWGQPPALLKGWIERVLRLNVAYRLIPRGEDGSGGGASGLLRAGLAIVINTSDTAPEREAELFGDPLERIWRDCVFGFCGVTRVERRVVGPVAAVPADTRSAWLAETVAWTQKQLTPSA